jgi:hypothetical protein
MTSINPFIVKVKVENAEVHLKFPCNCSCIFINTQADACTLVIIISLFCLYTVNLNILTVTKVITYFANIDQRRELD